MARPPKKLIFSVPTDLPFTVRPARFRPTVNLKFLDFGKLRSRRCRVELGEYDGGCCATKLYAVVDRGMVVGVELDKSKGTKPPPPVVKAVLVKAVEALQADTPSDFEPVPVEDFFQAVQRDSQPNGPSGSTACFSLSLTIPWVGKRDFVCCVTWHRDRAGKVVIDEIGCGDWLSFQH